MQQVTKNQFIKVLHNYPESTTSDAQEVIALKESYPFSQVLHALAARLSKDHGLATHQKELQMAAVYAADRGVLKEVMTQQSAWPISQETTGQQHPETPLSITAQPLKETKKMVHGDVADEVIQDLNRLHELKHNFESLFIDVEKTTIKGAEITETIEEPEHTPAGEKRKLPGGRKPGNSKARKIIELAKALESEETSETGKTKEDIIDEIKTTKKKIKPETEKQREQLEIINQFIKSQPSIASAKDKTLPPPSGDLSTIKSGEFSDHIVSETLVEILLSQGKKEKAIEVLKKLIWKFPQKKSYFAAQIEELKNSII